MPHDRLPPPPLRFPARPASRPQVIQGSFPGGRLRPQLPANPLPPQAVGPRGWSVQMSVLGGTKSKTLLVACAKQRKTNWCWAAVSEAVINFKKGGGTTTQEDLADTFTSGRLANEQADPWGPLNAYGLASGSARHAIVPWDALVDEIDRGFPIVAKVGKESDAHYILLIGYSGKSNRDPNREYIISDPENGGSATPLSSEELKSYDGRYIGSVYTKG